MRNKKFTTEELRKKAIEYRNPYTGVHVEIEGVEEVDERPDSFVKVYCSPDRILTMVMLSPRGHHLLNWIGQNIDHGVDLIWINRHAYMEESGIKRSETYISAVADLVEHKILNRASFSVDVYWINPFFFFKGNRLKKYATHLKKEDIKGFKTVKK
jgi:hypothetical protein